MTVFNIPSILETLNVRIDKVRWGDAMVWLVFLLGVWFWCLRLRWACWLSPSARSMSRSRSLTFRSRLEACWWPRKLISAVCWCVARSHDAFLLTRLLSNFWEGAMRDAKSDVLTLFPCFYLSFSAFEHWRSGTSGNRTLPNQTGQHQWP